MPKNIITYKLYNSYSNYLKHKFGTRVQKVSVNLGLTCPNRDGTKGTTGCIYCLNEAFTPSYCNPSNTISEQLNEGITFHKKRYKRAKAYLAYFQSYTNTYIPLNELEKIIQTTIKINNIVGLVFSTRPDAIDESVCELFEHYANKTFIKVEIGIESFNSQTLQLIGRNHTIDDILHALQLLNKYDIPVCGHFIFGLPGETKQTMLNTAKYISDLPIQSVKLHQLQIYINTPLAYMTKNGILNPYLFELPEYIDFIINFCEILSPRIAIERFASEAPPRYVIAPQWGLMRYDQILKKIEHQFEKLNTYQGRLYQKNSYFIISCIIFLISSFDEILSASAL